MTGSSGSFREALSFYCKNGYRELLLDHVKRMMNFDPGSRLIRLGSGHTRDFVLGLKIAIAFHDIGKIPFSEKMDLDEFYKEGSLTFTGHEFLSFFLLEKALLPEVSGLEVLTGEAAKMSVLLHHHPQNIRIRFSALKSKARYCQTIKSPLVIRKSSVLSYLDGLKNSGLIEADAVRDMENNLESSLGDEMDVNKAITGNFDAKITEYVDGRRLVGQQKLLNIFIPMLLSLITMDYVSASERQKCGQGSEGRFSQTAFEFYRYYLTEG